MSVKNIITVVAVICLAGMLTTCLHITQAKADHCHPTNTNSPTATASPSTQTTSPAKTTESNFVPHQNGTRVLSINNKQAKRNVSSIKNRPVGQDSLSIEEIYARDFPMVISSIGQAVKAIQSGNRQTELVELNKALDKLTEIHKALGNQVKPQFANSLICPIMGSPIDISTLDKSLMREYKNRKIAFCCNGCPAAWDKLSDVEKQAKFPGIKS